MDVIPFRGYRYNSAVVGDSARCIAPPYDVIDTAEQGKLYEQNPYNIVRITKGKTEDADVAGGDVYSRAAQYLQDFIASSALQQDKDESIYVYAQDFVVAGQPHRRTGFVALGKLCGYGEGIKPHEQTLAGPKADRLNLMRATKTQIGQIFMLYDDPTCAIDKILARACQGNALLVYQDDDGVTHCLFAITDKNDIATVQTEMAKHSVFIADGHHRYETALNYYDETKNPAAAHQMMTFVNTHNEGLLVLPTHRLVSNVENFSAAKLVGQLQENFDVARLEFTDMVEKQEKRKAMLAAMAHEFESHEHAFGAYFDDGAFYVATLRDVDSMKTVAPNYSEAWRKLDVSILHKLILEQQLGIGEEALTAESHVEYIKDFGEATAHAIDRVDSGQCQALFFVNPTRIEEVEAVAAAGEKMPQKSTFFYPKIFSGLVLNVLQTVNKDGMAVCS
ncbi:MAG: DUF1015 domain-containing protein [Sedimentisphaerales bacterium]|nr:DUF1015 domain-containing protein [Sedimentisphaerales bacterium]